MLITNTSKKIVQTRHQSGLDVLKSLAPAILLSYSKSVVSIVLIIALFRLSSKNMILKIEGKAYRTATLDGQFILSVLNLPNRNIGEINYLSTNHCLGVILLLIRLIYFKIRLSLTLQFVQVVLARIVR